MTRWFVVFVVLALVASGCAGHQFGDSAPHGTGETLTISAIPDQEPATLMAREEGLAAYLADELGVDVEFVPVTDYAASVNLFRAGDLDMVFYGGLTGVQARLQTPGAAVLAQRDIDARFRSVFIANTEAEVAAFDDIAGLTALQGKRFTFGSESSTSGRLMPEYFLGEAGVDSTADFAGEPGFSGSHDKTIDLVQAGSYQAGALNMQVWESRKQAGTVDLDRVVEVYTTPTYHDYHWLVGPDIDDRFGEGFTDRLGEALLALDGSDPREQQVLQSYGAGTLIAAQPADYDQIEEIARKLGLVT